MKQKHKGLILLFIAASLLCSCETKVHFTERIIDDNAPNSLWMKTIGDVNGDGKTDMLAGGWENGGMVAYLAPDWEKLKIDSTLKISTDAEVCDVDNDNIQDVVTVVEDALIWFDGQGWNHHLIDSAALHDVEVGYLDNDGLIDIVARDQAEFGHAGDKLYIYQQQPAGEWNIYTKPIPNGEGLVIADVNGDSKQDIIINGYWFENTGNIREWEEHKFTDTWEWRNTFIDVADINNDGLPDMIMSPSELAGNYYHISWFEGSEDTSSIWVEHIVVDSIETVIHFIGAADFNLDGNMDFMIAQMGQGNDPDEVAVYYQQKGDRWEKDVISTGGSHSMRLFDFDQDGDIDALGANHNERILKMWENQTNP